MDGNEIEQLRTQYADRIRREVGVRSAGLVRGLATVPREDFVGPGPWMLLKPEQMGRGYQRTTDANPRYLYDTVLVALDAKRGLNNGEPTALLKFLDSLELRPGERFLHIGCGVGYYTAIAAHALLPGGTAVGMEIDPELAARALKNLAPYDNADALLADGSLLSGGPFDAIFRERGRHGSALGVAQPTLRRRPAARASDRRPLGACTAAGRELHRRLGALRRHRRRLHAARNASWRRLQSTVHRAGRYLSLRRREARGDRKALAASLSRR